MCIHVVGNFKGNMTGKWSRLLHNNGSELFLQVLILTHFSLPLDILTVLTSLEHSTRSSRAMKM